MGTEDEPAQGARLALPEAIPELQAGAGATAAPACSHSSCLCLQEHRTRGEHGHGGSRELQAASPAWQRLGTIPAAWQMLTQELSLMVK